MNPTPTQTPEPKDATPAAPAGASSTPTEPAESVTLPGLANGTYPAAPSEWPQVHAIPQRTRYTPEILGTNFQIAWRYAFQPEKVHPQVQAYIHGGRVFVGTEMGNLVAIDAQTGSRAWVYQVGSPILNSDAADGGREFLGAMDGAANSRSRPAISAAASGCHRGPMVAGGEGC